MLKSKVIFVLVLLLSHTLQAQQNNLIAKLDSLQIVLKKTTFDTVKVNVLIALSSSEIDLGNYLQAENLAKKALSISESTSYKKGIANATYKLGVIFSYQGFYSKALEYLFIAEKISKEINYKYGLTTVYCIIGNVYTGQNNYKKALEIQLKGLKMSQEINSKEGIAKFHNNIGNIYFQLQNYDKAIESYNMAIKIDTEIHDVKGVLSAQLNIANIYANEGSIEKSLQTKLEVLDKAEQFGNKKVLAIFYDNIALDYNDLASISTKKQNNDYLQKAELYYFKSLKLRKEMSDLEGVSSSLQNIGAFYLTKKDYHKSLEYLTNSLIISKKEKFNAIAASTYELLYKLYQEQHNYKEAFNCLSQYSALKDSLFNLETTAQIADMQTKYDTEKKEKDIELLQKEKTVKDIELQKQKQTKYFLIIALCLFILIACGVFLWYRQQATIAQKIAQKNEEIKEKHALLVGQTNERNRIAKELHDGIGGALAGIKLNLISVNKNVITDIALTSIINNLNNTCEEVRIISHNLSSNTFAQNDIFIQKLKQTIKPFDIRTKTKINFNPYPESEINALPDNIQEAILRTTQEMLNNAYKYANATSIDINLSVQQSIVFFLFEDNGIGFDNSTTKQGIGLINITERVIKLNGKCLIDSKLNRGTSISIEIPIK